MNQEQQPLDDEPVFNRTDGIHATGKARAYIAGNNVRVQVEDTERYGRTVAQIKVQGGDLGATLTRDGVAWHYERYAPNAPEYDRLERQAATQTGAYGHKRIRCPRGSGEITQAGRVKPRPKIGTARTSTRSGKHSGSSSDISQGPRTVSTVIEMGKLASLCRVDRNLPTS